MEKKTELTILLPLYNPPVGWVVTLKNSFRVLFTLFEGIEIRVLLVNDGSSENLDAEITELKEVNDCIRYVTYARNKGKGFAIWSGLLKADSEFYIYTDWDFPFGEDSVYRAYHLLKQSHTDLLVGSRSPEYFASLPFFRKIISKGLHFLAYPALGFKNIDTQAGIKGLTNAARLVFLTNQTTSFLFELEFIRNCLRRKMSITFLPVSPRHDITFSNFGIKTISREMAVFMKLILT